MNRRISLLSAGLAILIVAPAAREVRAQRNATARVPVADVFAGAARLDFVPRGVSAGFVLTVSGPDGTVEQQDHEAGRAVFFTVAGPDGKTRPDGVYTYELRAKRAAPAPLAGAPSGNETVDGRAVELESAVRSRPATESAPLSGSFWIQNGQILAGNALEPRAGRAVSTGVSAGRTPAAGRTALDVVTADDAIIQGSACIGLDCVINESFGFQTIRLKENNTRIGFVDTSASVGFATNDWAIQANSSASGGANYLGFVDQGATGGEAGAEAGTLIFQVTAGAPASSLLVDSSGRLGLRTATPVLDVDLNTSNTPALRLDQNSGGGFTAQTWDIAGNEANFFVRDVTGGSRLPFRIRPGAPTSSIDISAIGNVGIGTASPSEKLEIKDGNIRINSNVNPKIYCEPASPQSCFLDILALSTGTVGFGGNGAAIRLQSTGASADGVIMFSTNRGGIGGGERMRITEDGRLGIGTTTPAFPLQMASGAFVSAGGVWTNASSREYKQNIRDLSPEVAEDTLAQLNPVTYSYKAAPGEHHVGFIAEDVPEMVATPDRKGLSSMDIVGVLTKVVQEQQKTIKELSGRLARIEAAEK
jgi:hypothetical protein